VSFEPIESYERKWHAENLLPDVLRAIMPEHIYVVHEPEVLSLTRDSILVYSSEYLRAEMSLERVMAFINWHVGRFGEVWYTSQRYDTLPRSKEDAEIRVMNVRDTRCISNGMYVQRLEPGVFYRFMDVPRRRREPIVYGPVSSGRVLD